MKHVFKTAVLTAIIAICAVSLPATAQTSRQNTKKQMAKAVINGSKGNVATVTTSNKPKTKSASEAKGKSPSKAKETPKAKTTTATAAKATTKAKATTTAAAKATTKAAANSQQNTKTTSPKAQSQDDLLIIKDCSFAGISLGMKMKEVPKSVPGIYDEYLADQADCSGAWSFYCFNKNKYDGTNPEIIVDDNMMDKKVDQIIVCAKGARIADTKIAVGVPISKVKNTPGLKPVEYSSSYVYGKNYWVNINDETGIIETITIHYSYE